jgi:hypothetical protein
VAWFYEIRSSNNAVLKREGGFTSRDSAIFAGREDVKIMKGSRRDVKVGPIVVGQNMEKPTRN